MRSAAQLLSAQPHALDCPAKTSTGYCKCGDRRALRAISQAQAEALEQAAKEAERLADKGDKFERDCAGGHGWFNLKGEGQREAAQAIRALVSTGGGGGD